MLDRSIKDFREMEKREIEQMKEWERNRIIRRCRSCGQPYSFDRGETDPKECMRCRGVEGDLIF
jgi:redox-regulated HSP33 family molecular chaperone